MTDKKFWSEKIRGQTPYTAGEQPKIADLVKLNTNENPYPPSPKVIQAIRKSENGDLRLYPPVINESNRFWGNGSDEVLAMAFIAFFSGKRLYAPDVTYSFYPVWAKMFDVDYHTIPLNEDFTIPVEKFCRFDGGIIIANPNAPTGLLLGVNEIERIVATNSENVVIIDEAYIDFANEPGASDLLDKYPNLLVVKTASKSYSLAGLRVGWAEGNESLIEALTVARDSINSYTLDRLAVAGIKAAFGDREYFKTQNEKVIATRERTKDILRQLGFGVTDSQANFVFAAHPKFRGEDLYKSLRKRGILVRWWNLPRINNHLRITIGTDEQMNRLFAALREEIIGGN
ncbi:MAG: aminotransferase class I/II-fold pyridoxal phosphate-dependent enzyme [Oscillospiraceae bacterium]|nr:aminotransferase class I/II-fold pyridoxal phosphate-dependent enzyme [Oscillospiraceae bacterium]